MSQNATYPWPSDDSSRRRLAASLAGVEEGTEWVEARSSASWRQRLWMWLGLCRPGLRAAAERAMARAPVGGYEASDLVQETCVQAGRDLSSFRGTTLEEFRRWLTKIQKHRLIDARRHDATFDGRLVKGSVSLQEVCGGDSSGRGPAAVDRERTPAEAASYRERQEALRRAILGLSAEQQEVLELRHRDRLSFAEIGGRLGKSEEAARKIFVRALERLREVLGPSHEPD